MALKVLTALDTAKIQYYHFKAIIIAGMGLFTDAYDLFCIPPIMRLIGRIYYPRYVNTKNHEKLFEVPAVITSNMIGVALLGAVIGQLVFGFLGDRVGRRRVYGVSLMLMVIGSIGCGFSLSTLRPLVLISLGFFRFVIGIGIGGDYPLSATIMSEFANRRTRGAFIAAVFSMQGIGIIVSSIVTMVVCASFNAASGNPPSPAELKVDGDNYTPAADVAWRLILMIGAIPAGLTYYWRMKMPETARFTALVANNELQAARDMEKVLNVTLTPIVEDVEMESTMITISNITPSGSISSSSYPLFSREFLRQHGRDLFAAAANWFLIDVAFYSLNLFQSYVYKGLIPAREHMNAYKDAYEVAKYQAIVACFSTLPGYVMAVYLIDRLGRVKIQIAGFFCMAISLFILGFAYRSINSWDPNDNLHNPKPKLGFMVLYGMALFFSNFGPNTTTFIIPAELFPARFRATCHGIAGAAGKVGAIIGSVGFLWASQDKNDGGIGVESTLVMIGGVCVVGMVVTYLFTRETVGRSLEDNENADKLTGVHVLRGLREGSSTNVRLGTSIYHDSS